MMWLGAAMLAVLFGALFFFSVVILGRRGAFIVWAAVAAVLAWINAAVWLMTGV